jgi:hypothetical protein
MGLGKITRGLGKVGLAFEALGYVVVGGKALIRAVKGVPDTRRDDDGPRQGRRQDNREEEDVQG